MTKRGGMSGAVRKKHPLRVTIRASGWTSTSHPKRKRPRHHPAGEPRVLGLARRILKYPMAPSSLLHPKRKSSTPALTAKRWQWG